MASAQHYLSQLNEIVRNNPLSVNFDTISEAKLAKQRLTLAQKMLRQIKSEVSAEMTRIRDKYKAEEKSAGAQGGALLRVFGKKGAAKSYQATAKRQNSSKRDSELAPFKQVSDTIAQYVLAYSELKLKIDEIIEREKSN